MVDVENMPFILFHDRFLEWRIAFLPMHHRVAAAKKEKGLSSGD